MRSSCDEPKAHLRCVSEVFSSFTFPIPFSRSCSTRCQSARRRRLSSEKGVLLLSGKLFYSILLAAIIAYTILCSTDVIGTSQKTLITSKFYFLLDQIAVMPACSSRTFPLLLEQSIVFYIYQMYRTTSRLEQLTYLGSFLHFTSALLNTSLSTTAHHHNQLP